MTTPIRAKQILTHPVHFLAFGFGSGLSPIAPGTFGTLAAIPIYLLFSHFGLLAYIALTLFVTLVGIWICGESSRLLGVHDHGGIVWDEIAGYLITMLFAPAGWVWVVIGFVLFRLFDIWKPYPIRWIDKKVSGGLGIMLDDVLAGIYALIVLQGIYYFFPGL
jgi:phosphatidylglycerophosphatase A